MTEAAISILKDHLPEMIYMAEQGNDIHITRHGKPVAVLISLERYQQAFPPSKGIATAWQRWRLKYPTAQGFSDEEQAMMTERRQKPREPRASVWEE